MPRTQPTTPTARAGIIYSQGKIASLYVPFHLLRFKKLWGSFHLDTYLDKVVLPHSTTYRDGADPSFLVWSDAKEQVVYVADAALYERMAEGSRVKVKKVSTEELYGFLGKLYVAHRDQCRVHRPTAMAV